MRSAKGPAFAPAPAPVAWAPVPAPAPAPAPFLLAGTSIFHEPQGVLNQNEAQRAFFCLFFSFFSGLDVFFT